MISDSMARVQDFARHRAVGRQLFANHEEGRLRVMVFEYLKDSAGVRRVWAVVEREAIFFGA